MEPVPARKLAAILSADVVGYSRPMERDEASTLARLKSCRDTLSEKIAAHHGRIVSTTGDALLAEFGSVVNAVDCAVRFHYLGPQEVKNITESVQTYRVLLGERTDAAGFATREQAAGARPHAAASSPARVGTPHRRDGGRSRRGARERLKRRAALVGVLIAFLFAINALTWGGELWAKWPTLGVLLVFGLRTAWAGWKDEA